MADPWACLVWAWLLLVLPLRWLLGAAAAAAVHELCHFLAAYCLGGRVRGFRMGIAGAVMTVEGLSRSGEGLCAAAGPMGSLALVLLWHRFPILAVCGLVQGCFNLLPIFPLDGGRILRCLRNRP